MKIINILYMFIVLLIGSFMILLDIDTLLSYSKLEHKYNLQNYDTSKYYVGDFMLICHDICVNNGMINLTILGGRNRNYVCYCGIDDKIMDTFALG
jgi:hypothetical protein